MASAVLFERIGINGIPSSYTEPVFCLPEGYGWFSGELQQSNESKSRRMARQKGIIKLQGTIGDVSFYKSKDGYLAREKGGVDGERIKNDPAFQPVLLRVLRVVDVRLSIC